MKEHIVIISGTNRNEAVSLQLAAIYKNLLHELDIESTLIDLKFLPADFTATALYENAGTNDDFNKYRAIMRDSNKFIFIVPEYNGSFPGVLKAFIDGLEFPGTFRNKKAALVGLSSGVQGAGLALSHLTDIFNYCGTHVLAAKPKLARIDDHLKEGELTNPLYITLLKEQAEDFINF